MGSLGKGTPLMLVFSKAPLLPLIIFLMMLSLILLSMMIILFDNTLYLRIASNLWQQL